jgi:hypothetical protein
LKEFAVSAFSTNDKLVLLLSMGVVIAALAVAAGLAVLRVPRLAAGLVLSLGVVAAVAAASRPDATLVAVVPSAVGVAAGLAVLLAGRVRQARVRDRSGGSVPRAAIGRREVVTAVPGPGSAGGFRRVPGVTPFVTPTDVTGETQLGTRRPPKPDGATGWHSVTATVA